MANSETILSAQTYNQLGGSAQSVVGEKYRGDGYYGRSDGFHTVQIGLTNFIGKVEIQGTLAVDPVETDWFTVELGTGTMSVDTTGALTEENITSIDYTAPTTIVKSYNFIGNYVWVRAKISNWTVGTVNSIKLNH